MPSKPPLPVLAVLSALLLLGGCASVPQGNPPAEKASGVWLRARDEVINGPLTSIESSSMLSTGTAALAAMEDAADKGLLEWYTEEPVSNADSGIRIARVIPVAVADSVARPPVPPFDESGVWFVLAERGATEYTGILLVANPQAGKWGYSTTTLWTGGFYGMRADGQMPSPESSMTIVPTQNGLQGADWLFVDEGDSQYATLLFFTFTEDATSLSGTQLDFGQQRPPSDMAVLAIRD